MKRYIISSTNMTQDEFESRVRDVCAALVDIQEDNEEFYLTYNFGVDENGDITAGVDVRPSIEVRKDPSKVENIKKKVEDVFRRYGYVLDGRFKVNPGKTFLDSIHYQIIENKGSKMKRYIESATKEITPAMAKDINDAKTKILAELKRKVKDGLYDDESATLADLDDILYGLVWDAEIDFDIPAWCVKDEENVTDKEAWSFFSRYVNKDKSVTKEFQKLLKRS